MWAIMINSQPHEFIHHDPEGKYHPDVDIVQIPQWLQQYVTTDYRFVHDEWQPPSREYLKNQLKAQISQKISQLSQIGTVYKGKKYPISIINHLKHFVDMTFDRMFPVFWENEYGEISQFETDDAIILYNGALEYQQELLKTKNYLFRMLDDDPLLNNDQTEWNMEELLEAKQTFHEISWPDREIKGKTNDVS